MVPVEVTLHAVSVAIQQTIRDFRSDCSEWEGEFRELFSDVDRFLSQARQAECGTSDANIAQDVAGLKGLVEQQTEVLTALVNALTGQPAGTEVASEDNPRTSRPPASEIDPFERLQQAVAAASESS
jgi:hypothetical protein